MEEEEEDKDEIYLYVSVTELEIHKDEIEVIAMVGHQLSEIKRNIICT